MRVKVREQKIKDTTKAMMAVIDITPPGINSLPMMIARMTRMTIVQMMQHCVCVCVCVQGKGMIGYHK